MHITLIIGSCFVQAALIEKRAHNIQKTPMNYFFSVVEKFNGKVNREKLGAAAA